MPSKKAKAAPQKPTKTGNSIELDLKRALAELKRSGTAATRDGMARYGITAKKSFGVTVAQLKLIARQFPRNHELALALWESEWYEARMLATMVDDPKQVTPQQMEAWCRDFDSWAICDTACFKLFDQTPHAWAKVWEWASRKEEFVLRASFALLASLALHDKKTSDEPFLESLQLIEKSASDDRNFVKKGVSWALRGIGSRSPDLHRACLELSKKLSTSPDRTERWIGKDALNDLSRKLVKSRVERKESKKAATKRGT
jgi:3-methyladenine DNA glycosylase AlkD